MYTGGSKKVARDGKCLLTETLLIPKKHFWTLHWKARNYAPMSSFLFPL